MAKPRHHAKHHPQPSNGLRPFWSGTLSFGLVSVPVDLYPGKRLQRASLRMLSADGAPLERRYWCPEHGRDIHPEHILRGYEVAKDEYVIVRDEELEALEPEKSRDIDLRQFVDLAELDPVYFERPYFLAPSGDSDKAYRLLSEVMEKTGRAGIATFVMRDREYLVAIISEHSILRAQTLRFHDELRTPDQLGLPEPLKPAAKQVTAFKHALKKLSCQELPAKHMEDEYSSQLRKLAEHKWKQNEDVVRHEPADAADEPEEEIDLLETIRRSIAGASAKAAKPSGNGAARSTALAKLNKSELYERAKESDIAGRSQMTKEQLIKALQQN